MTNQPNVKAIIAKYVERKDLYGLAEYARAMLEDSILENDTIRKEARHEAIAEVYELQKECRERNYFSHRNNLCLCFDPGHLATLTKLQGDERKETKHICGELKTVNCTKQDQVKLCRACGLPTN